MSTIIVDQEEIIQGSQTISQIGIQVEGLKQCTLQEYIESAFQNSPKLINVSKESLMANIYEFQLQSQSHKWRFRKSENMLKSFSSEMQTHDFQAMVKQLKEIAEEPKLSMKVRNFLEQSDVRIKKKFLNCYVLKRAGGRHKRVNCWEKLSFCHQQFQRRYLTLTSEGVCLSLEQFGTQSRVRDMILFDQSFQILFGKKATGYKYGIVFKNISRNLCIKAYHEFEFIDIVIQTQLVFNQCQSNKINPFDSFSPIRHHNFVKAFVDAHNYFDQLYQDIESSKEEIFITDWWLSPELYLKRSDKNNEQYRIDRLFQKKAIEGVKIYIILYNEPKLALSINSQYTQTKLNGLHQNISVIRHPSSVIPMLWSHHEKLVVIDQQIAYVGGVDLCYGRYDTQNHPIFEEYQDQFPGCDYSNSRITDFKDIKNFSTSDIDRNEVQRMPWHDIQIKLVGSSVRYVAKHFIQYWNFVLADLTKKNDYNVLQLQDDQETMNRWDRYKLKISQISQKLENFVLSKLHIQHDTQNQQQNSEQTNNNKQTEPQIQLVQSQIQIQTNEQKEIQLPDLQKCHNRAKSASLYIQQGEVHIDEDILNAMKKQTEIEDSNYIFQPRKKTPSFQHTQKPHLNNEKIKLEIRKHSKIGTCSVQVLRSASKWSLGLSSNHTENSIQKAYIQLIQQSKDYIYIENQFFMTSLAGNPLLNPIGLALIQRINNAFQRNEKFHVIIVLPLLPGFEGEVDDNKANLMKLQLHYEYQSLCRGGSSLLEQLDYIPNLNQYLTVAGLRNHGLNSKGIPKTEIIYVHSKLMIIDDRFVLCGSANINDRSLKGTRDSELALLIQDSIQIGQSKKFAYDLRTELFMEHFNINDNRYPNDPELIQEIQTQMRVLQFVFQHNSLIYRKVFACYPDDNILTIKEVKLFSQSQDLSLYSNLKDEIKGFAVEWPTQFLKNECLKLPVFSKEVLLPDINFT